MPIGAVFNDEGLARDIDIAGAINRQRSACVIVVIILAVGTGPLLSAGAVVFHRDAVGEISLGGPVEIVKPVPANSASYIHVACRVQFNRVAAIAIAMTARVACGPGQRTIGVKLDRAVIVVGRTGYIDIPVTVHADGMRVTNAVSVLGCPGLRQLGRG